MIIKGYSIYGNRNSIQKKEEEKKTINKNRANYWCQSFMGLVFESVIDFHYHHKLQFPISIPICIYITFKRTTLTQSIHLVSIWNGWYFWNLICGLGCRNNKRTKKSALNCNAFVAFQLDYISTEIEPFTDSITTFDRDWKWNRINFQFDFDFEISYDKLYQCTMALIDCWTQRYWFYATFNTNSPHTMWYKIRFDFEISIFQSTKK